MHGLVQLIRGGKLVQDRPIDIGRAEGDEVPRDDVLVLFGEVPCRFEINRTNMFVS